MTNKLLEKTAKVSGYSYVDQLLMDYDLIVTVLTSKHKKVEIVKVIAKSFTNQKQNVLYFRSAHIK